jgi:hypothetical protein
MKNLKRYVALQKFWAISCFAGFSLLVSCTTKNDATVQIKNKTNEVMLGGDLEVSSQGRKKTFGRIEINGSTKLSFRNFTDGEYLFYGKFESGKTVRDSGGYVTHGLNFDDEIVLSQDGDSIKISIHQNQNDGIPSY